MRNTIFLAIVSLIISCCQIRPVLQIDRTSKTIDCLNLSSRCLHIAKALGEDTDFNKLQLLDGDFNTCFKRWKAQCVTLDRELKEELERRQERSK
jgi:hypothetical protein